ncbi:hydrogenase expression/formation protein HypE [Clostridium sp.]|uniref:hydrogenase expression/formation protein HypE n=1 Tax=Clostridium sp. TaxID=1506 RepID=UPI002FC9E99A
MERIGLIHGEGGKHTQELIKNLFYKQFNNEELIKDKDAAVLALSQKSIAFTTDSFVVKPLFFNGGDIGRLCICGTVNDLVTSFALPKYLSLSFIIEEGFDFKDLEKIVVSIKNTAIIAEVQIVTGDTKVVEKGMADGIFINTSGIGIVEKNIVNCPEVGDKIIITSTIAEHGTAIAMDRYNLEILGDIRSDVKPLNDLIPILEEYSGHIKLLKDPTRGGIGQCFNEIIERYDIGIRLYEEEIPIRKEVETFNEIIGLDPYYLASEGVMILIVKDEVSESVIRKLKSDKKYENAAIVGEVVNENKKVIIENKFGGRRVLKELEGIMLPRIC